MMKKLLIALLCFTASFAGFAQGNTGEIEVYVLGDKGEPLPFANVLVYSGSIKIGGGTADMNGVARIKNVPVGEYTVKVTSAEYPGSTRELQKVRVSSNAINRKEVKFQATVLKVTTITAEKVVDVGKTSTETNFSREQLAKLPSRDISTAVQLAEGANGNGETTTLRGSRGSQQVIVDGVKMRGGVNLPLTAVQEITIITGGIPAELGDATGGYQIINTRGIVDRWFGSIEANTSQFLDPYGHHLGAVTVGGPIAFKTIKDSTGKVELDQNGKARKEAVAGII